MKVSNALSTDRDPSLYYGMRKALYDGRLVFYEHPDLIREMQKLTRGPDGRIDHPKLDMDAPNGRGSKDLCDGVAAVFTLASREFYHKKPILPPSFSKPAYDMVTPQSYKKYSWVLDGDSPIRKAAEGELKKKYGDVHEGEKEELLRLIFSNKDVTSWYGL